MFAELKKLGALGVVLFTAMGLIAETAHGDCGFHLAQIARHTSHKPLAPRAQEAYEYWTDLYDTYQKNKAYDGDVNFRLNPKTANPQIKTFIEKSLSFQENFDRSDIRVALIAEVIQKGRQMIKNGTGYYEFILWTLEMVSAVSGERFDPRADEVNKSLQVAFEGVLRGFFFRMRTEDLDIGDFVAAHHIPLATVEIPFVESKKADGSEGNAKKFAIHDLDHAVEIYNGLWEKMLTPNRASDVYVSIIHRRFMPYYRNLDLSTPVKNKLSTLYIWYTSHELTDHLIDGIGHVGTSILSRGEFNLYTPKMHNQLFQDQKNDGFGPGYSIGRESNYHMLYSWEEQQEALSNLSRTYPGLAL